ncbi:MAG: right-handed parallel beta-helix repeat-containing protein [Thermoplasmatales archaeon]|nr:MAG: right-handed parallel beta-helix repeat-containing protein [Thermoplasmatales archaeon]
MKTKDGFILMAFLLFIGLVLAPSINANKGSLSEKTIIGISDGNHPPIIINGNDDFTPENGVTGGNGTENDPYIIEDWIIVGDGSASDGIFINNTNAYFMIRNCTVYDFHHPDMYYDGVKFSNVENGGIENTSIYKSHTGIDLRYSTNIKVSNCSCYDFPVLYGVGINCYRSTRITIKSSECYNLDTGIDLTKSSDIIVEKTKCYNNDVGLNSFSVEPTTMHIIIKDSKFYDNEWYGVKLLDRIRHPSYSRVVNCEFYNNGHEPKKAGLAIQRLSNNIVENCSFHNNYVGMSTDSENNIIRNCSAFNNLETGFLINGALLVLNPARNNKIINCDAYNNLIGIGFWSSFGSVVEKCNVYNNSVWGIENDVLSIVRIKQSNIYENGYNESYRESSGLWAMWFSFVDARDNWWGAEDGPRFRFHFGHGDQIKRSKSIVLFRPWEREPIPDAGVK